MKNASRCEITDCRTHFAETGFGIFTPPVPNMRRLSREPLGPSGTVTNVIPWPINTVNGTDPMSRSGIPGYSTGSALAAAPRTHREVLSATVLDGFIGPLWRSTTPDDGQSRRIDADLSMEFPTVQRRIQEGQVVLSGLSRTGFIRTSCWHWKSANRRQSDRFARISSTS